MNRSSRAEGPPPSAATKLLTLATAFLTGKLVLMIEILEPRLLQSYFGSGLHVWSATISVTLLSLALGYGLGGRIADRCDERLGLPLALIGTGGSVLLLLLSRGSVLELARGWDLRVAILFCSILYFLPSVTCLGMIGPLLVARSSPAPRRVGAAVGRVYAISTLGSVVGALLTGFVLVGRFSVTHLLLAAAVLAIGLGLLWCGVARSRGAAALAGACGVLAALVARGAGDAVHDARVVHCEESFFGQIKVVDVEQPSASGPQRARFLLVDGREQTILDADGETSWLDYVNDLQLARAFRPEARTALVLGLGGGMLARGLARAGLEVDAVEIDPRIHEIAKRYFGLRDSDARVHHADGRYFVETTGRRFDLAFVCAFRADCVPLHLCSREMMAAMSHVLSPRGVLAYDFLGFTSGLESRGTCAFDATLRSAFPFVQAYCREQAAGFGDILFFASHVPLEIAWSAALERRFGNRSASLIDLHRHANLRLPRDGDLILTDDFDPLDVWLRESSVRWHDQIRARVGADVLLSSNGK